MRHVIFRGFLIAAVGLALPGSPVLGAQDAPTPKPPGNEKSDERSDAKPAAKPDANEETKPAKPIDVGAALPVDVEFGPPTVEGAARKPRVLLYWSVDCPVCRRYAAVVKRLAAAYSDWVSFLLVVTSDAETDEQVRASLEELDLRLPFERDDGGAAAKRLGVRVTPTALLVDGARVLRYRGALDDDRLARLRDAREHLRPALEALVNGKTIEAQELRAFGSALRR